MGIILAKLRREKTTYQLLEKLEEKIRSIEEFSISTQERQKRFVGNFLIISIGLYVIAFVVFYFLFFPPTWLQRIAYTTPLLMFPIVIILLKRLFAWYYQRKLNKNSTQLNGLRDEKKKIIEKVMETETYKVAIDILNRFGDSSSTNGSRSNPGGNAFTANQQHNHHHRHQQPSQSQPNHHQHHTQIPLPTATPYRSLAPSNSSLTPRAPLARQSLSPGPLKTPVKPGAFQFSTPTTSTQVHPQAHTLQLIGATPQNAQQRQQQQQRLRMDSPAEYAAQQLQQQQFPKTPYPIINFNAKGYMEKLVDFLIGEGISSQYGMICKKCFQHNGMATLEEYEFSAFCCAFCKTLNPARKLRPIGPKIPGVGDDPKQRRPSCTHSPSDTSSGSESEATVDVGSKLPKTVATDSASEGATDAEKSSVDKKTD